MCHVSFQIYSPTPAAWFFGLIALIMGSEAGAIGVVLAKVGIALPQASRR